MKLFRYSFLLLQFPLFISLAAINSVAAEETNGQSNLVLITQVKENRSHQNLSTSALDLLAQQNEITEVTGVKINQTDRGLEVILETAAGEQLVPLILPEGNNLIVEILDATLVPKGNEFREINPAAGIREISVTQVDDSSIRLTITGENNAPTAEVLPSQQNLVLSVSPEGTTVTTEPDEAMQRGLGRGFQGAELNSAHSPLGLPHERLHQEEIEIIATGEGDEDDYFVPNATSATRTDAEIRDIPQSIQVIPQEVIEEQQAIRLEEVVTQTSGVTFFGNQDGRSTDFAIRGFNGAPSLRDGFRLYTGFFQGIPEVANLERIEILKGPASVLYGEIQPGGLINLVSKQPLAEPFYDVQLQLGNRSLVRTPIDFSGTLTADGSLSYRLNALYRHEDSFRNYDESFDRFFVAPTLAWQISDRTDLTFNLEYIKDDNPADFGTVILDGEPADIPPERITNNPDDTIENEFLNTGYTFEHRFSENWKLRNAFRYLVNDYNYGGDNEDILALPFEIDNETGILTRVFADQEREEDNYYLYTNVEGKFATGSIKHNVLFGVDLGRTEAKQKTVFNPGPSSSAPLDIFDPDYDAIPEPDDDIDSIGLFNDDEITTDRLGIYIQDKIDLFDNLILLAGLRYDTVDQTQQDNLSDTEQSQNNDAFTPRVGIVYQPIETVSLYASYSQSFNPNTFDTTAEGGFLEPEEGEGFEVGVKGEIIPNRLAATLAYFDITKQNVATADPNVPFSSIATGEQQSQGIELDLTGEILPGWNIITSYAYIDAEVSEDNDPEIVGSRLPGIPEHSASLWTTYEIQKGSLEGLGFGIGFNFVGEREGGLPNSFEVDSYFLTNAALFYSRENWQVRLNFDNLFDVNFIEAVENSPERGVYPGEPFTIRGSISVQF